MLYLLDTGKIKNAFWTFYIFGFISYGILLYWIPRVMVVYGGMSEGISYLGILILGGFLSIFTGLAGWLIKIVINRDRSPLSLLLIPFIWTAKNLVLEHIVTGFPWCFEGYSQYKNIYFVQIAEWGGVHLVSFVVIYFNVLLYMAVFRKETRVRVLVVIAVSLIAVYTSGYFLYKSNEASFQALETHRAGILQPNTRNEVVLSHEVKNNQLREFLEDSRVMLEEKGADFVIWPEFSINIYPLQNRYYRDIFTHFAERHGPVMGGFTDYKKYKYVYNSLILFDRGRTQKYDKVHLTPFGEYIPFKKLFFFVNKITDEVAETTPGTEVHNLDLQGHKIAPPICYELIFPQLVRDFVDKGGEVIVITSNDAWYGNSSAIYQLLCMSAFRGIENRRYVLRSTTNGISAAISWSGEILYQAPFNEKSTFVTEFKYNKTKTIFTRFGYLFPYLCAVFLFAYFVFIYIRRKQD